MTNQKGKGQCLVSLNACRHYRAYPSPVAFGKLQSHSAQLIVALTSSEPEELFYYFSISVTKGQLIVRFIPTDAALSI